MESFDENPVIEFYTDIKKDPHHRYKSWEHCYNFFQNEYEKLKNIFQENHKNTKEDDELIDRACLHLGFYLASWGMYRPSSFLLQKDYKCHEYAIKEVIFNKRYDDLWDLDFDTLTENDNKIDLIFQLKEDIKNAYKKNLKPIERKHGRKQDADPTPKLVSKIIMGTIGCTPAYDRYFCEGLKKENIKYRSSFDERLFCELLKFYKKRRKYFDKPQEIIEKDGMKYPVMKLIDMYFWQIGFTNDFKKQNKQTTKQ